MVKILPNDIISHIMSFEDIVTLNKNVLINKRMKQLFSIYNDRLCRQLIRKRMTFIETPAAYNFCEKNHTTSITKHNKSTLIKAMHLSNLFK